MAEENVGHSTKDYLIGSSMRSSPADDADDIAYDDHKIAFVLEYARDRTVLDLGCVEHNPDNYRSRFWLHKAIARSALELQGLDLYEEGVSVLVDAGYNVTVGDATSFDLGRSFDVIVAGDLIEHLGNIDGFLQSCKRHMHEQSFLLVSTPNPWYWKYWVQALYKDEVPNNPEHSCWFCPRTFRQVASRHGIDVRRIEFGSRRPRDRFMPLPKRWRHTSFHLACQLR